MKKVINENVIRNIVRESLIKILKESKDQEIADMYDEFGNNNVHDTKGRESMWAQGADDEMATHIGRATRSTGSDSLKAAKRDKFFGLDEDKDQEIADMYDEFGNNNIYDTNGRESMWAQGDGDEIATHIGRATRSTGSDSLKAAKDDKFFQGLAEGKIYKHRCADCGKRFKFDESEAELEWDFDGLDSLKIRCPYCGRIQFVYK
jgi:DNA-directed RNA polymerase subunit RPC12/RpoP